MKSKIKKLLREQSWMIHDLIDGNQIENDEETRLLKLYNSADVEFNEIVEWLLRAYTWFDENENINVNSTAYKELEKIIGKIK